MDPNKQQNLYRIGTVASLTGISVERLRAWERRYDMSPAHKAGKTRFYSKPQLDRLKLIKHLIDQGQPISSLAGLSFAQLQARIEEDQEATIVVAAHTPTVGLVGPNLLMLERQAQQGSVRLRMEVVSRWANLEAFELEQTATDNPQVVILQLPVLSLQPIEFARETFPEAQVIAVYQFATSKVISQAQTEGIPTLKWPVSWSELEHVTATTIGLTNRPSMTVARRFSDEELIAIAAATDDPTQCPQYLIEAIHQLNAFAQYAQDCSHTVDRPKTYHRLQADASQARAQLEVALESLVEDRDSQA
ncbi:MAG: MerR family transcriptional regulator [Gammaproteobacteria bacterium]|nr:MerR family transcriptional regulator [Gammaproteobacteria bacterium]